MKRLLIAATPVCAPGLRTGPNKQYENGAVFSRLFGHKSIKDASATGTDAEPR
jgi:hypothetical protein